jgi:hypothetical protein
MLSPIKPNLLWNDVATLRKWRELEIPLYKEEENMQIPQDAK